jgi:hypothetical protein
MMPRPQPDGMMRTARGIRIAVRPAPGGEIVLTIFGIEVGMALDESHQLRDMVQAAELQSQRGEVIE